MDRMSTTSKFWITILLGIVGSVLSYGYMYLSSQGWLAQWTYLGVLPEKPVGFLTTQRAVSKFDTVDFTIEMVSGKIYRYDSTTRSWMNVIDPPPAERYYLDCYGYNYTMLDPRRFPPWPSKVIACAYLDWSWEWFVDRDYIIALEDGSVWTRNFQSGPNTAGFVFWDPLTTIFIGWGMIWLARNARAKQARKENRKLILAFMVFGIISLVIIFGLSRLVSSYVNGVIFMSIIMFTVMPLQTCSVLFVLMMIILLVIIGINKYRLAKNKIPNVIE